MDFDRLYNLTGISREEFEDVKFGILALSIGGYGLHPVQLSVLAKAAQHQEDVIQVMAVLPGKYRYEAVEAAITASGIPARDIYMDLAVGQPTVALARFYEALGEG